MPTVSVIMGIYNCKSYDLLQKSINSIIGQTYTDWELIICNDGSTDSSLEKLESIAKTDERIKLISYDTNGGLNYALNQCLKLAQGSYIARQDDDDFSEPERFEKQVAYLTSNREVDIVGTCAAVYDDKKEWGKFKVPEMPQKIDFLWNSPFIHPSVMMRASSLKKANGYRVAKETRRCEDYDLFMRMYSLGMQGYNIQEYLYHYRMLCDGKKKYRPLKFRIDEAVIRFIGYKKMGILMRGLPYILKPVLIGFIPAPIFNSIQRKQYRR